MVIINGIQIYVKYIIIVSAIDFYCLTLVAEEHNPPVLSNVDQIDHWIQDLQIRECVTDVDKKQKGPVIYLSLPDKARSACRNISVTDLKKVKYIDKQDRDIIC